MIPTSAHNLKVGAPKKEPLRLTGDGSGALTSKEQALVDWYVSQDGSAAVDQHFYIDLYLDNIPVNRWSAGPFGRQAMLMETSWTGLLDLFELEPGEHTLTLVVDPTNLVDESSEEDNKASLEFKWEGPAPAPLSRKIANLVAAPPRGADSALFAGHQPGSASLGGLSIDSQTFFTVGVKNAGVVSVRGEAVADLYINGVYMDRFMWNSLAADSTGRAVWAHLAETYRITPGEHTVALYIDPMNRVPESAEWDNVYTTKLAWLTGTPPIPVTDPSPTPALPPQEPRKELPDLAPVVPQGWDSHLTLTASQGAGMEGRDGPVTSESDVFISYALTNASPKAVNRPFRAALSVDGRVVDEQGFAGGPSDSGNYWTNTVQVRAGEVKPGEHRITVRLDAGDQVAEDDESNNVFERSVTWLNGPLPTPSPPVAYTDPEVRALLSVALTEMMIDPRPITGPQGSGSDWEQAVLDAGEAGYFLLTGRSLKDERITIRLLSRDDFEAARFGTCMERSDSLSLPAYEERYSECASGSDEELGFKTRYEGRVQVFVDTDHSPAQVLGTLFHELGHALQDFKNPEQSERSAGNAISVLLEAQAQTFEAAAWRRIEEFTGQRLLSYPDSPGLQSAVDDMIEQRLDGASDGEEHDLGYVLMWMSAMTDAGGSGTRSELDARGTLSATSTYQLFEHMVSLQRDEVSVWAQGLLARVPELGPEYRLITMARLVPGLAQDDEGHPALMEAAFLAP